MAVLSAPACCRVSLNSLRISSRSPKVSDARSKASCDLVRSSVTLPWEEHGGTRETMDVGELSWVIVRPETMTRDGRLRLGKWSTLPREVQRYVGLQLCQSPRPILLIRDRNSRECFRALLDEFRERVTGWEWRVNRLLG